MFHGKSSHRLWVSLLSLPSIPSSVPEELPQGCSRLHSQFQGAPGHLRSTCSLILPMPNTSQKNQSLHKHSNHTDGIPSILSSTVAALKADDTDKKAQLRNFWVYYTGTNHKKNEFYSTFSVNFSAVPAWTMSLLKLPVKPEPRLDS